VSPHTVLAVSTAAHSSVSTHSTCCAYSCTQNFLHTQHWLCLQLHTDLSPHTVLAVSTAAHSSVSTHNTCCAYSCTQNCLHTQYLLCLQLHTVVSPHTALAVSTAAHSSVSTHSNCCAYSCTQNCLHTQTCCAYSLDRLSYRLFSYLVWLIQYYEEDAFLSLIRSIIFQIWQSDVTNHQHHLQFRQHTDFNTVQLFPLVASASVPPFKDVFSNVTNRQRAWLLAGIIPLAQCNRL